MRVFTCNDFEGRLPVGSAAVVIAKNAERAHAMLIAALEARGLPQKEMITITEQSLTEESCTILVDGDY